MFTLDIEARVRPEIATRAMIRDQFEGDAMARVMSFMFTLFILVPMRAWAHR
jgi:DHA1 family bicyclomycin/chloramphenicol resistance-like MFS transporter